MSKATPIWLTIKDVEDEYPLSYSTIYKNIRSGNLKASYIGKYIMRREWVEEFFYNNVVETKKGSRNQKKRAKVDNPWGIKIG